MDNPMYNAILRWSITQTDTTAPSPTEEAKPMDPEKRAFLQNVMDTMVEKDSKTMKDIVEIIKGPEDTLDQANVKQEALDDAIDRCDRIDYAVSFHAFANGLFPTIELLAGSEHGGVRGRAAELLALVVKDNAPCQAWAFEGGALEKLLALHAGNVKGGGAVGETEKLRAVGAMNALIQLNPDAQLAFIQAGGIDALKRDLKPDSGQRLKARTLFVMRSLLLESASIRDVCLSDAPLLSLFSDCSLLADDEEHAEHATAALEALAQHNSSAVKAAVGQVFVASLQSRITRLESNSNEDTTEAVRTALALLSSLSAAI
mmetsp:Transcript_49246/g.79457  ORF Transcript_49246/g.79457 Transcript_49246/m.79457 type:complete len:317 (+) Transcript_49246:199-1149(+)|eukprot:CAMPEP_0179460458 /NCGR_PEP_ID=MMETSP0799-20121207/43500_1 /TAXON_ID=46947 /ORGANISM="Geminigera cryophila, Strain CCMP2564" /LENGTH=316 /DNA_ID=CAMNT_0021262713 /DNA_START=199 /DNA_END=1149 /DNA_ORIENTATION=+